MEISVRRIIRGVMFGLFIVAIIASAACSDAGAAQAPICLTPVVQHTRDYYVTKERQTWTSIIRVEASVGYGVGSVIPAGDRNRVTLVTQGESDG